MPGTQPMKVKLEQEDWEELGIIPWFSYQIKLPQRPLPATSARPEIRTERLIVRPLFPADLQQFYELRRTTDLQVHSPSRGRPDRDMEETTLNLAKLQEPNDERHWYFGAFLASTGELIGEGGIPDSEDCPTSGWTRVEVLIKPEHWRQGYGTEFFNAVMEGWWDLPRERRRHQLLPMVAGDKEPGDEVTDCVEFVWEETNIAARNFFAKALGQRVAAEGTFVMVDWREGRERNLVRWGGTIAVNPR